MYQPENFLNLNQAKCKFMLISRKRNPVLCLKPLQLINEEKEDGEIQIILFSYWTFTVLLGVLLRCYKARVTSVE